MNGTKVNAGVLQRGTKPWAPVKVDILNSAAFHSLADQERWVFLALHLVAVNQPTPGTIVFDPDSRDFTMLGMWLGLDNEMPDSRPADMYIDEDYQPYRGHPWGRLKVSLDRLLDGECALLDATVDEHDNITSITIPGFHVPAVRQGDSQEATQRPESPAATTQPVESGESAPVVSADAASATPRRKPSDHPDRVLARKHEERQRDCPADCRCWPYRQDAGRDRGVTDGVSRVTGGVTGGVTARDSEATPSSGASVTPPLYEDKETMRPGDGLPSPSGKDAAGASSCDSPRTDRVSSRGAEQDKGAADGTAPTAEPGNQGQHTVARPDVRGKSRNEIGQRPPTLTDHAPAPGEDAADMAYTSVARAWGTVRCENTGVRRDIPAMLQAAGGDLETLMWAAHQCVRVMDPVKRTLELLRERADVA